MISQLNAGRMMQRLAPAARSNMPQGGLSTAGMAAPGGSSGFNERTGAYTRPVNPMINALRNPNVAMTGGAPTAGSGMLNGVLANIGQQFRKAEAMPMTTPSGPRAMTPQEAIAITSMANQRPVAMDEGFNPVTWMGRNAPVSPQVYQAFNNQMAGRPDNAPPMPVSPIPTNQRFEPAPPAPSFDRNAALQAFNNRAAEANKMFTNGLFGAGVSPDEFRNYQTNLRNLQLDQNSTQQQHEAALKDAMAFMNRVAPMPVQLPRYQPQGMALGGLMAKYHGGMC